MLQENYLLLNVTIFCKLCTLITSLLAQDMLIFSFFSLKLFRNYPLFMFFSFQIAC